MTTQWWFIIRIKRTTAHEIYAYLSPNIRRKPVHRVQWDRQTQKHHTIWMVIRHTQHCNTNHSRNWAQIVLLVYIIRPNINTFITYNYIWFAPTCFDVNTSSSVIWLSDEQRTNDSNPLYTLTSTSHHTTQFHNSSVDTRHAQP